MKHHTHSRVGAVLAAGVLTLLCGASVRAQGSGPPLRTISEIQGSGPRSPLARSRVSVRGVVTQLTRAASGLWIQDPAGDGDPLTSDGIFVLLPDAALQPAVGDRIELEARVQELAASGALPLTRLVDVSRISVLERALPLPQPAPIVGVPDGSIAAAAQFFESLEGMRVVVRDAPVVAASTRFGELTVVAPLNRSPGSGRSLLTGHLLIRGLGHGAVDFNPERLIVARGALPMPATVRPGDRVTRVLGVLDARGRSRLRLPAAASGCAATGRSRPSISAISSIARTIPPRSTRTARHRAASSRPSSRSSRRRSCSSSRCPTSRSCRRSRTPRSCSSSPTA
jgi:hypothetical protein